MEKKTFWYILAVFFFIETEHMTHHYISHNLNFFFPNIRDIR